ncbi:hypothetical protein P153DRAFT_387306 [Dothidotthia symphoricarpi CBS 119687]|uniref:Uncharacterized protein n=1 Tax=Dothidotthia symphoricarpi CBS 119687 TaxID=1392245 RepID=A0A6A6A8Z4_9PLEO|nr:uncharacterized protein P153DRAFT_387306 [Dothidotthia symphoricarpi CBS 119687]KAF2127564.1 hypothetical protein P153DRAFT_387306 [Dothidotthia symphoricarpi CBS 119687]
MKVMPSHLAVQNSVGTDVHQALDSRTCSPMNSRSSGQPQISKSPTAHSHQCASSSQHAASEIDVVHVLSYNDVVPTHSRSVDSGLTHRLESPANPNFGYLHQDDERNDVPTEDFGAYDYLQYASSYQPNNYATEVEDFNYHGVTFGHRAESYPEEISVYHPSCFPVFMNPEAFVAEVASDPILRGVLEALSTSLNMHRSPQG